MYKWIGNKPINKSTEIEVDSKDFLVPLADTHRYHLQGQALHMHGAVYSQYIPLLQVTQLASSKGRKSGSGLIGSRLSTQCRPVVLPC